MTYFGDAGQVVMGGGLEGARVCLWIESGEEPVLLCAGDEGAKGVLDGLVDDLARGGELHMKEVRIVDGNVHLRGVLGEGDDQRDVVAEGPF